MNQTTVARRAVQVGSVVAVIIAIAGAGVGYAIAGMDGMWSGLIGAILSALFMGLTAVSIMIGQRVQRRTGDSTLFFAIIAGVWLFKLIAFGIAIFALRGAEFIQPAVFGTTIIVAVVASLAVDVWVFWRTRETVVPLPQSENSGENRAEGEG